MRWPSAEKADSADTDLRDMMLRSISDDDLNALVALGDLCPHGQLPPWADEIIEKIAARTAERMQTQQQAKPEAEHAAPIPDIAESADFGSLLKKHWRKADVALSEKLRAIAKLLGIDPPERPMKRLKPPREPQTLEPEAEQGSSEIAAHAPAEAGLRDAQDRSEVEPAVADPDALCADSPADKPRKTVAEIKSYWTTGEGAWW